MLLVLNCKSCLNVSNNLSSSGDIISASCSSSITGNVICDGLTNGGPEGCFSNGCKGGPEGVVVNGAIGGPGGVIAIGGPEGGLDDRSPCFGTIACVRVCWSVCWPVVGTTTSVLLGGPYSCGTCWGAGAADGAAAVSVFFFNTIGGPE